MSLAPAERAAFLDLLPELGPDGDRRKISAFLAEHPHAAGELGARPGMDQVRAGLLRVVDELGDEDDLRDQALAALSAYAEDVQDPDPAVLLERAPSWVGLAWLEARGESGWTSEAALEAAELARTGFAAAKMTGIGEGELLWALAEAAAEVGWTDRERFLLDEARQASFEAEERAGEVALLYAMRCLEDGDEAGLGILEEVSELEAASARTRIHARAILGAVASERGDREAARAWFEGALAEVDPDEEPDVAAQLESTLASL
ncbi:MAG: hypothetical protein EP330_00290 [Deltaproteobacteria bacterium]|nr:MAG: hypothetical protein EP330_00290 [Deltaproteobacteria bacterium]